jgi:LPS export ABC transporter protein LptC
MWFAALLTVAACGPVVETSWGGDAPRVPAVVLEDLSFEGYTGPQRQFEVKAVRADVRVQERLAVLEQVEIQFRPTARGPLAVVAERGELNLDREDFVLSGVVNGTMGEGERFSTSEVWYSAERDMLLSDQRVRVRRGGLDLEGVGMELDVSARKLRLLRDVVATQEGRR